MTTITLPGSLLASWTVAMGAGTIANASTITPAIRRISMVDALPQSRCGSAALVVVVATDVGPLQSIRRPHSAPAAVVSGVGEGRANERKAMEAVMEEAVMEAIPEREPGKPGRDSMRKGRAREAAAAKMRAAADGGEMRPAAPGMHASPHAAGVHATSHPAGVHPTSHPAGMHAASHSTAHATAASSERRRRKGKCRTKRSPDEATQKLAVHPDSSVVELQRRISSREEDDQETQMIQ